jgi:hypothetical protein
LLQVGRFVTGNVAVVSGFPGIVRAARLVVAVGFAVVID